VTAGVAWRHTLWLGKNPYGFLDDSPEGEIHDAPVKPGTIRVILADSQAIYRVGIRKVFALEDDLRVVAQADSLENLRAAIERYPTDIVLLEGSLLAGTANVIPDLLRVAPDVKLIVQAVAADENQTVELYRRGVRGIVSRSISPDLLVRCVRASPPAKPGSTINRSIG
jgi:DNA-binding NarL/FixJ family response regulator